MMTLNKARELAIESLTLVTGRPASDVLLLDDRTQCRRAGWIFFYESRAYVESGEVPNVGATGPVVVTHAGNVHHLSGEQPVDETLREFEQAQRQPALR
jgi:Immunity protein 35